MRGSNGQLLAAAGAVIAAAGIWHLIRSGTAARWVIGVAGVAVLGFAAYLLMRLAASTRSLGGDSMVLLHGGPGLWVVAAGGLAAFSTMFFPAAARRHRLPRHPPPAARRPACRADRVRSR